MSEIAPNYEPTAEVVEFPDIYPRELNSTDLGDEDITKRLSFAFSRKDVLDIDEEARGRFVVKAVLESLEMTGRLGDMTDESGAIKPELQYFAQQTSTIDRRLRMAEEWYQTQIDKSTRREVADTVSDYRDIVDHLWDETNFNRAFKILGESIRVNRTDKYASAIIEAHRLAVIMMAQLSIETTDTEVE